MNIRETVEVTVRCVEHNRLLEIFYRIPEDWRGWTLTNVGDPDRGHNVIVADEDEVGIPGEVTQRRHLVLACEQWINRHRGGIDRTELGFKMESSWHGIGL